MIWLCECFEFCGKSPDSLRDPAPKDVEKSSLKKLNFLLKFACDTDLELKIFVASSINDKLVLQDMPKVQIMLAGLFFGK